MLTHLKLLDKAKGVLINFNCVNLFKEGQKTLVTKKYGTLEKGYYCSYCSYCGEKKSQERVTEAIVSLGVLVLEILNWRLMVWKKR